MYCAACNKISLLTANHLQETYALSASRSEPCLPGRREALNARNEIFFCYWPCICILRTVEASFLLQRGVDGYGGCKIHGPSLSLQNGPPPPALPWISSKANRRPHAPAATTRLPSGESDPWRSFVEALRDAVSHSGCCNANDEVYPLSARPQLKEGANS
jgi:hypothetical protein